MLAVVISSNRYLVVIALCHPVHEKTEHVLRPGMLLSRQRIFSPSRLRE